MSTAEHNRSVTRSQHEPPAAVSKAKAVASRSVDGRAEPGSSHHERRQSRRVPDQDADADPDADAPDRRRTPARSSIRYTMEHTPGYADDHVRAPARVNDSHRTHHELERTRSRPRPHPDQDAAASDVEVVEIIKRPGQTLGFYIREGNGADRRDGVFVSRIAYNSALAEDNFLRVGDEILSVNGVQVRSVSLDDVVILMSVPQKLVFEIRRGRVIAGDGARRRAPPANRRTMELRQGQAGADDSNDSGLSSEHSVRSADQRVRFTERQPHPARGSSARRDEREEAASELESSRARRQRAARGNGSDHARSANGAGVNHKDYSSDTEIGLTESTMGATPRGSRRNHASSLSRCQNECDYRTVTKRSVFGQCEQPEAACVGDRCARNPLVSSDYVQNDTDDRYATLRRMQLRQAAAAITPMQARLLACDTNVNVGTVVNSNANSHAHANPNANCNSNSLLGNATSLLSSTGALLGNSSTLLGNSNALLGSASVRNMAQQQSPLNSPLAKAQQLVFQQQLQQQAYDSLLNVQQRIQEQSQPLYGTLTRRLPLLRTQQAELQGLSMPTLVQPVQQVPMQVPVQMPAAYTLQSGQQGLVTLGLSGAQENTLIPGMVSSVLPATVQHTSAPLMQGGLQQFLQVQGGNLGLGQNPLSVQLGNHLLANNAGAPSAAGNGTSATAATATAAAASTSGSQAAGGSPGRGAGARRAPAARRVAEQPRSQMRVNPEDFCARPSDRISRWGAGRPTGDGLEGQLHVHLYSSRGLLAVSGPAPVKDLYCVLELDSTRRTRTAVRTGVDEFDWDEWFELDLEGARVLTLLLYSWDPDTAQHQHTLHFYGHVSLMHFFQEQRAAHASGAAQAHKVALRLEPKGVMYLDVCYRTLFVTLRRPLAALTVVSNADSGSAYLLNGAQIFGVPIDSLVKREQQRRAQNATTELNLENATHNVPSIVKRCVEEVELRGLDIVGLYRQTGSGRTKQRLREQFERFDPGQVDMSVEAIPDVHVITSLLKDYLRELPEPLFTVALYRPLLDAMRNVEIHEEDNGAFRSNKLQGSAKLLLGLLDTIPVINQATIMFLMDHLKRVAKRCDTNKMTRANLAVCFGPLLLCPSLNVASNDQCVFEIKKQIDCLKWLLDFWPDMTTNSQTSANFASFYSANSLLQLVGSVKEDPLYQHPLLTSTADSLLAEKTAAASLTLGRKSRTLTSSGQRTLPRYRSEQSNLMASEMSTPPTPQKHDHRRKHHHSTRSRSTERPS